MGGRTLSLALHTTTYTITASKYTVANDRTISATSLIAIDFTGAADTLINNPNITGAGRSDRPRLVVTCVENGAW